MFTHCQVLNLLLHRWTRQNWEYHSKKKSASMFSGMRAKEGWTAQWRSWEKVGLFIDIWSFATLFHWYLIICPVTTTCQWHMVWQMIKLQNKTGQIIKSIAHLASLMDGLIYSLLGWEMVGTLNWLIWRMDGNTSEQYDSIKLTFEEKCIWKLLHKSCPQYTS